MSIASCAAASASSRRPSSLKRLPRLLSDLARSGRNASGRAAASRRWMSTASCAAASASSRRPSSLKRLPRLLSDSPDRAGTRPAARRRAGGEFDRLLRRRERVLAPPEFAQATAEIVERPRQIGQERVRPRGGEAAMNSTASCAAASASSRRPSSLKRLPRLLSDVA